MRPQRKMDVYPLPSVRYACKRLYSISWSIFSFNSSFATPAYVMQNGNTPRNVCFGKRHSSLIPCQPWLPPFQKSTYSGRYVTCEKSGRGLAATPLSSLYQQKKCVGRYFSWNVHNAKEITVTKWERNIPRWDIKFIHTFHASNTPTAIRSMSAFPFLYMCPSTKIPLLR